MMPRRSTFEAFEVDDVVMVNVLAGTRDDREPEHRAKYISVALKHAVVLDVDGADKGQIITVGFGDATPNMHFTAGCLKFISRGGKIPDNGGETFFWIDKNLQSILRNTIIHDRPGAFDLPPLLPDQRILSGPTLLE